MTMENPPRIVIAGAGTGKTHWIETEILRLVKEESVAIETIGAITFTDAAAAELQERIRRTLLNGGLREAAIQVDAAPIQTIHSFCLDLLRRHPLESGLPPEPLVLGDIERALLLHRAVTEAMDLDEAAKDVEFFTRHEFLYQIQNSEGFLDVTEVLRKLLEKLIERAISIRLGPEDFARIVEENEKEIRKAFGEPADPHEADTRLRVAVDRLRAYVATTALTNKGDRGSKERLEPFLDRFRENDSPDLRASAEAYGRFGSPGVALAAEVEKVNEAADLWWSTHPQVLDYLVEAAQRLFSLTAASLRRYQALKSEIGALDYEDMLGRAHDLLLLQREGVPFAVYVAEQLRHLFIDEFQDTSPLQFRIMEILRESGVRVTYVGDVKQAIYAFRAADHHLLQALIEIQSVEGLSPQTLTENRRSRPELIDLFNGLFARAFGDVKVRYDELQPGPDNPYVLHKLPKAGPSVDLVAPVKGRSILDRIVRPLLARIRGLLRDRSFKIYDRHAGIVRELRAGDIAIIARSHAELDRWCEALTQAGLRYAREISGWSRQFEVVAFRALLRAAANPLDGASLAGLLHSELVGARQRTIARLAGRGFFATPHFFLRPAEGDQDPWMDLLATLDLVPLERAALERFRDDLLAVRSALRVHPLPEALEMAAFRFDVWLRLRSRPNAEREIANVRKIVEVASKVASLSQRALESCGLAGSSLEDFLDYLERLPESKGGDQQPLAMTDAEHSIRLTTIHGAKGLEYPVVVFASWDASCEPGLARIELVRPPDARSTAGSALFALSRIRCFALLPEASSLYRKLAEYAGGVEEEEADGLRLLYVTFTRAREHLVLLQPEIKPKTLGHLLSERSRYQTIQEGNGTYIVAGKARVPVLTAFPEAGPSPIPEQPPAYVAEVRELLEREAPSPSTWVPVAPALPEILPLDVTPEALAAVADCPEAYRLQHLFGVEFAGPARVEGPPVDHRELKTGKADRFGKITTDNRDLGSIVHQALLTSDLVDGARLHLDAVKAHVLRRFAARKDVGAIAEYAAHAVASAAEVVAALTPTGRLLREWPFVVPLGSGRLVGTLDLAIPSADGWHVLDYKTHPIPYAAIPRWAEYYRPQLVAYGLALSKILKQPVAGLHLVFPSAGIWATLRGRFEAPLAEKELLGLATVIAGGTRGRPADRDCGRCAWLSSCAYGRRLVAETRAIV